MNNLTAVGILCNTPTAQLFVPISLVYSARVIKVFLNSLPAKEDLLQEREDEIMMLLYIGVYGKHLHLNHLT